jgi:hypothetical protein
MVNYPSSEDYVRYIIKDSRKYNMSFVFITQELEDMLQSPAGRSILNNTSTQFIFHQKESAMALMKSTMNLTEEEYDKLLACAKGEGLMISDRFRLLFRVKTSQTEHELISTDPNEKKRIRLGLKPQESEEKRKEEGLLEVSELPLASELPKAQAILGIGPDEKMAAKEKMLEIEEKEEKEAQAEIKQRRQKGKKIEGNAEELEIKATAPQPIPIVKEDAPPPIRPVHQPIVITHGLISPKEALKLLEKAAKKGGKKGKAKGKNKKN